MNESKPYVSSADDCSKYYVYHFPERRCFQVYTIRMTQFADCLIDITDHPVTINDYPELLI